MSIPGIPAPAKFCCATRPSASTFSTSTSARASIPRRAACRWCRAARRAGVVLEVGRGRHRLQGWRPRRLYRGRSAPIAPSASCRRTGWSPIPDDVSDEEAAASLLKGLTVGVSPAPHLSRSSRSHTVLYHAAAGGVGLLFGQWARHIGATVIGTAGSPEKIETGPRQRLRAMSSTIRNDDFVEAVKEITGGKMCDVVYDSVGKDTLAGIARLPAPARHVRLLRPVFRVDPALLHQHPVAEGLALRDAADALHLHRQARRPGSGGCRAVRADRAAASSRSRSTSATRWPKRPVPMPISRRAGRQERPS